MDSYDNVIGDALCRGENPEVALDALTRESDECSLCGELLCKHGLCSNTGDPWTDGCAKSYGPDGYQCQNCAEAAQERQFEEYWGGSTPQNDREREEVQRATRA